MASAGLVAPVFRPERRVDSGMGVRKCKVCEGQGLALQRPWAEGSAGKVACGNQDVGLGEIKECHHPFFSLDQDIIDALRNRILTEQSVVV
jgi:hypothetical protein